MAINFLGKEVSSKKDVESLVAFHTLQNFGGQDKQFRLLSEAIVLIMATLGKITFAQTGLIGVIDQSSADNYITNTLLPLWQSQASLKQQADKCISDNNLK